MEGRRITLVGCTKYDDYQQYLANKPLPGAVYLFREKKFENYVFHLDLFPTFAVRKIGTK